MSDQYRESVQQMDRQVYEQLLESLSTGRWPDGRALTETQRQHAMRAVITWGEIHLSPEERIGFIDKGAKAGDVCDDPEPLTWSE
ncbi:MAG: DUF1315 family protein [Luminiphilus sp.]